VALFFVIVVLHMKPSVDTTPTISVVFMVKNEERNVDAFFETINSVADEVIVVDTGSTDGTLEHLHSAANNSSYPVRILSYVQPRFHDGATREWAARQCTKDYILQLDADERLSPEFKMHVKAFLRQYEPVLATVPRVDDLVPHFIDVMPNRLYKRGADAHFSTEETPGAAVHAEFVAHGKTVALPYAVYHQQGDNHWLRRPERIFDQLSREIRELKNVDGFWRELRRGMLGFYYKYRKTYYQQQAYKDGAAGRRFAILKGLYVFLLHLFVGLKPKTKKL
jgi:glycosyltransferase involved in cell wall biosynthesis